MPESSYFHRFCKYFKDLFAFVDIYQVKCFSCKINHAGKFCYQKLLFVFVYVLFMFCYVILNLNTNFSKIFLAVWANTIGRTNVWGLYCWYILRVNLWTNNFLVNLADMLTGYKLKTNLSELIEKVGQEVVPFWNIEENNAHL